MDLLIGWSDLPQGGEGGSGYTAAGAIMLVEAFKETIYATLHSVMREFGDHGRLVTSSKLGAIPRGLKANRMDGLQLEACGKENGSTLWRVFGTYQDPTDSKDHSNSLD